ncbi:MAG: PaaI family thioesterase [Thermodesulfobacteriota bacterium]
MADDRAFDTGALANVRMTGFDGVMGFHILHADRDRVEAEYTVGEQHRQPYGIVHGGVHCGVIESVCSTGAALDAMPRGQSVVGIENHTSFIRAVREGKVRVVATPITRGRRSQVWEATARDAAGRVVATGRVRLLCLDAGSDLAGETLPAAEPVPR